MRVILWMLSLLSTSISIVFYLTVILAFFGFVHAVEIKIGSAPEVALGYLAMALVFIVMSFYCRKMEVETIND